MNYSFDDVGQLAVALEGVECNSWGLYYPELPKALNFKESISNCDKSPFMI